jgi:hypothetical protein
VFVVTETPSVVEPGAVATSVFPKLENPEPMSESFVVR